MLAVIEHSKQLNALFFGFINFSRSASLMFFFQTKIDPPDLHKHLTIVLLFNIAEGSNVIENRRSTKGRSSSASGYLAENRGSNRPAAVDPNFGSCLRIR